MQITGPLIIQPAHHRDIGCGIARMDYDVIDSLDTRTDSFVEIISRKRTVVRCLPVIPSDEGKGVIRLDDLTMENIGSQIGKHVYVKKIDVSEAERVIVAPLQEIPPVMEQYLNDVLYNQAIVKEQLVAIPYFPGSLIFTVKDYTPLAQSVMITSKTKFQIENTNYYFSNNV
ncbi:AAA family ATPase, CDC48 subfamily protein (fragment) [Nitrosotalea devaniterrae]|uniref:AAA family ATPase, CDC48 subfamily protein n=1 Tax=Nitrosotalea devaniterrae TaxID=1078905 RepID=A0A128A216_9ARCH